MIKLENVVLASPEQMEFIIEGMRNPMNSWEKSDSEKEFTNAKWPEEMFILGENDHSHDVGVCENHSAFILVERI